MSKLECPFNYELLVDYATGNADAETRQTVEPHLSQCTHCRREVMRLEQTWWALDTWQESAKTVPLRFDRLETKIAALQKQAPFWKRAWALGKQEWEWLSAYLRPASLIPATVMTAILAFMFVFPMMKTDIPQTNNPAIAIATPTPMAQPDITAVQVASADNSDTAQGREARFQAALQQGHSVGNGLRAPRLPAQTAGFRPNSNIWSSVDEDTPIRPSYEYGTVHLSSNRNP